MAANVPDGAAVNMHCTAGGADLFIEQVTLSAGGAATVAHGFTAISGQGGRVSEGATPTHAWVVPLDGEDHSGITVAVDATNVEITAGAANGVVLVFAIK